MSSLTINELLREKSSLERDIQSLINRFSEETGVSLSDIELTFSITETTSRHSDISIETLRVKIEIKL